MRKLHFPLKLGGPHESVVAVWMPTVMLY